VIVDGGPYYLSRNPIYVAFTLIAVGVALLVNSGWGLASAAIAVATVHFATVLVEERYLRAHIGDEYARYTDRVRRWL
jgi:protein-S-isoprenylcysteine O-methyltransferase Ste14